MSQNLKTTVWDKHSNQWGRIGSPCRPTEEDGQLLLQMATPSLRDRADAANVVVMGVTPEIVQLAWPAQVRLQAFDHSPEMIASVWRPHPNLSSNVQQVRWQNMPLADHSIDCIVGDGSLTVIDSLEGYPEILVELARVLEPEGSLVLRCFVSPDQPERVEDIAADALSGSIKSFHALKWRVAMAMCAEREFSVRLMDISAAINKLFPDRNLLVERAGWLRESIDTMGAFDGVESCITFPTLSALTEISAPCIELVDLQYGRYEMAECCPTICFKPRNMD